MNTARIAETIAAQLPPHIAADVARELLNVTKPRCKFDGCNSGVRAQGYCHTHYEQLRRKGVLDVQHIARARAQCKAHGCGGKAQAKGYCNRHYKRFLRHGDPYYVRGKHAALARLPNPDTLQQATCQVDGCGGPMQASGMCMKHYQQERRKHAA